MIGEAIIDGKTDRETPAAAGKIDPEQLELRARPRPVTRINRKVIYAGTAFASLLICGAVLFALDPPDWQSGPGTELLRTGRNQPPDSLRQLPQDYADIPKLGPPNQGDLGKPIVRLERELGIPQQLPRLPSYKPNPEDDFARAERIRLAKLAAKAQGSALFFKVRNDGLPGTANPSATGNNQSSQPTELAALTALAGLPPNIPSATEQSASSPTPGSQQAKRAFLDGKTDETVFNRHAEQKPVSAIQLMAGTVIAGSLITGLSSDLPGIVIAQVTEHIYDSVTGRHLLIPQGSRLIGKYDSSVSFGQDRALVVWQRVIRPDGTSVLIDNLPATDTAGYAGLKDKVDFHTWKLVKGIALATVLGVGTELTLGGAENELFRALRESIQQNTSRAGQRLVERSLNIQPTITIRPGWPIRIIVNRDIVLSPYKIEHR
ncbi:MAG: TrbI/VirB10 family protein [Rhizobiaceae bacterium]